MFFVRKENVGTSLGTQKEYAAAARRGVKFQTDTTGNGAVWHYLWPSELIEPSLRSVGAAPFYIWSQEVGVGELIGDPLITPFTPHAPEDVEDEPTEAVYIDPWLVAARAAWTAAMTDGGVRNDAQPQVS